MINIFAIFLIIFSCIFGCGKKAPPTLKQYEPPPVVMDFNAVRLEDSVILSWNYAIRDREKLEGFIIRKSHNDNIFIIKVSPNIDKFIDNNITEKETYRYVIYGVNKKGVIGVQSNEIKVKVCPLPQKKISASLRTYDDYIEITWEKPTLEQKDADCNLQFSYNIYKSDSIDSPTLIPLNKAPITSNSIKLPIGKDDIAYYHIRPVIEDKILHIGVASYNAMFSSYDLIPSKPKILDYSAVDNRIFIIWQEATESWVRGYKVYRMTSDGTFNEIAFVTTPIFTELIEQKIISYKITAVGPKKEGLPSDIINIKVK